MYVFMSAGAAKYSLPNRQFLYKSQLTVMNLNCYRCFRLICDEVSLFVMRPAVALAIMLH